MSLQRRKLPFPSRLGKEAGLDRRLAFGIPASPRRMVSFYGLVTLLGEKSSGNRCIALGGTDGDIVALELSDGFF